MKGEGGDQSVKTNFKLLIGLNFSPADIIYLPPHRVNYCELLSLPLSLCLFLFLWLRQSHDTQLSIFWGRGRLGVARFIHSNQDKGLHSEKKFTLSKCANQNHVGFFSFKELFERADIPKEHIDHQKHLDICQRFCRPKINLGS